jgi:hypothetical protein
MAPLFRGARTAGEAVHRRAMYLLIESDLSHLPAANKERLGFILSRHGDDGAKVIDGASPRAQEAMTNGGYNVDALAKLDGDNLIRAQKLIGDTDAEGLRILNQLDHNSLVKLFNIDGKSGYQKFDNWRAWRANLIRGSQGDKIDKSLLERYIDDVHSAGDSPRVKNEEALVKELSDSDGTVSNAESALRGQAGEARSTVRYARDGYDVELEPGKGNYDLALDSGDTVRYIEVKSPKKAPDFNWADDKISNMNNKLDKADVDLSPSPTPDNTVLEIRSLAGSSKLQSAIDDIESAIATRQIGGDVNFDEVRLIMRDGEKATIAVE